MQNLRSDRIAWWLCATFSVALLVGIGKLLKPYWVAKYRGEDAFLRGAFLPFAPLLGADLRFTDLAGANLSHGNLINANLRDAILRGANLSQADFTGADLAYSDLSFTVLRGANLANALFYKTNLRNARYDISTRWPAGFDPQQHGAVLRKILGVERRVHSPVHIRTQAP